MLAPPRRTQAERRAASRARLLDAAIDCLAERGYAGTTIPEVVRRAGLSNGALWRHFHSKADLLVAAVLRWEEQLAAGERTGTGIDAAVDWIWRAVHEPGFQAWVDLMRASQSDPELADLLAAIDERAGRVFFGAFAPLLGPDLAGHPQFERNVRLLGLTLYGVALTAGLRGRREDGRLRGELKELLRSLFGVEPPTP